VRIFGDGPNIIVDWLRELGRQMMCVAPLIHLDLEEVTLSAFKGLGGREVLWHRGGLWADRKSAVGA
jgi:hypothetical protein